MVESVKISRGLPEHLYQQNIRHYCKTMIRVLLPKNRNKLTNKTKSITIYNRQVKMPRFIMVKIKLHNSYNSNSNNRFFSKLHSQSLKQLMYYI